MTEEKLNELPKGWVWTGLGSIASIQGGFAFKSTDFKDKGIPLLRISNIKSHKVTFDTDTVFLDEKFVQECPEFLVNKGNILIALSGATTGKFGVYDKDEKALLNQRVGQIKSLDETSISSRLIFYYLNIIRGKILDQAYGMAQPNISTRELGEFSIPLPPVPEQYRIVAKIEELFTKLDAGVEALKKIKAQLKRYRQAVLKYAFEGKLTQEWREANKGEIEPASVLLEKIKNVRANNYSPQRKKKQQSLPPIDTSELPELPEGWLWATLGEVTDYVESVNPKTEPNKEFVYLDIASIDNSQQKITDPKNYFGKDAPSRARQLVKSGDILFSTIRIYLKNIAMVNEIYDGQIASTGFCVIRPLPKIQNRFIFWLVQTDDFLNPLNQLQRGTSYPAVRDSDVFPQIIPLPPFHEQNKIVEEIESRLSIADNLEKVVDQSLKQSDRLRQSILKRAFEGKLVPQDPTEEPAEKLLERIKGEKERMGLNKQKSKRAN